MNKVSRFFDFKNKLKFFWFQIKNKKSNIPDFNEASNILRVFIISYLIFFLFNISLSASFDDLQKKLFQNFFLFTPYLLAEIILLIVSSKIIKKTSAAFSIGYMFFTVFLSSYLTFSFANNSLRLSALQLESFSLTFLQALSILFFFIIYFDWKIRAMNPLDDIAKISFLQSKMDPHFLFNCLNTVVYLIKNEPKLAQKMIVNLSDLIRVSLTQKDMMPIVAVERELELVDKYLEIEKIRLKDRLIFEKDIEEKILCWKIPQFLIQPLIENSIRHGIQTTATPKPIRLKIYSDLVDNLIIEIKNDFGVQDTENIYEFASNGISLKNLKERIDLYYQGTGEMNIKKSPDEFYVYIKVPKSPISYNSNQL